MTTLPATEHIELRVLLVDDQPIIAAAVRLMLAAEPGLEFHSCSQFEEAEAMALRVRPTVILQDLMMEDMDGLVLVRRFRQLPELKDVPVVVLSASEEAENKVAAFSAGADDYVVKLPSALELAARVRYHSLALYNARQRVAAFQALLESQAALEARNREIEAQRQKLEQQAQALARANQELQESAFTDPLTGLRNRRYLRQLVDSHLRQWFCSPPAARPERHREPDLALLLFDVDHFKQVNDRYGHDAGDRVLIEVARRLRLSVRDGDAVIRWGGEEFLVVAVGTTREGASITAARILDNIGSQPIRAAAGVDLRTTVSLGWALYPALPAAPHQVPFERALFLADAAVYLAKRGGRNRACGVLLERGPPAEELFDCGEDTVQRLLAADGHSLDLKMLLGPAAPD